MKCPKCTGEMRRIQTGLDSEVETWQWKTRRSPVIRSLMVAENPVPYWRTLKESLSVAKNSPTALDK